MSRRWTATALLLALVALACDGGARPRPPRGSPRGDLPSSMAALGDSITAGFGSCLALATCQRNSWSTGDGLRVDSHYRRIMAANPKIRGHAHNHAVPGARAAGLAGQARRAVSSNVEYVTVLIGANDACRGRIEDMTGVAAFRADVDRGLAVLRAGLPRARVLVVSIPDLYRLWEVGHADARAARAWSHGICPALLANPTSTAGTDARRRTTFRARVDAYNRQLAAACRAYGSRCRYDGGAAHRVRFGLDMLNPLDWFHPDRDGQNRLAAVTYRAARLDARG
ncbi:Lysophospholipase L1 [Micromonospora pattaloongensis]|uniref:Lysophospholipase L1 n=1 Tax=Micromonospora pattaloongensis TaxID=405436 RepID=A0A1H3JB76_9ACTN|nr:SGNH/GDSL hydrolase family protein [Micromonospora pattaloongensis]SDY36805.1 Lysophospholipase L1 [Micromonospora pattaloongensis]